MNKLGIVIEGFNEGESFKRCLDSLVSAGCAKVYVDSGSTDGSLDLAASMGCDIVNLDVSKVAFNCARARNAGFKRLMELDPSIEFVQFVDADCEIAGEWLSRAVEAFQADPKLGVLCGRLREKYRDANVYGRLCDMEWEGPVGNVETCGGISMMRSGPFSEMGGFNTELGGVEELDLCRRLRAKGYRVVRIKDDMGLHDANMTKFGQWWRRTRKTGFVYAEAIARGQSNPFIRRQAARSIFWAALVPSVAIAGLVIAFWYPVALAMIAIVVAAYAILAWRIFRVRRARGNNASDSWLYAVFCNLSKWPQLAGQIRFYLRGRH